MDLRHLTDEVLLTQTEQVVKNEKQATIMVLYHIREVDRRRLYAELKFSSLFAYVNEKLGYDASEAYRRIAAMKLLTELPEIAPAVESGKLTLTHLNLAQTHFKKEQKARGGEKLSSEEKKAVLRKVVGVSTREAEKVMEKEATFSQPKTEWLQVDPELVAKLQQLRGLLAHSDPDASNSELLHKALDLAIEKHSVPGKSSIPAAVRKEVWRRDEGKCTNCNSRHAVQYDHFPIPKAMGGADTIDNLRLRCRSCSMPSEIHGKRVQVPRSKLSIDGSSRRLVL